MILEESFGLRYGSSRALTRQLADIFTAEASIFNLFALVSEFRSRSWKLWILLCFSFD